jgi:methenyltetrahydrofolate cyclohydrolase
MGMMKLVDLSARELLDRFASDDPTPGGGSASALSGACGAALVAMVSSMAKTRTGAPQERERLDTVLRWAQEAGARLRTLVDEDTEAYDAVVTAYRLPRETDEEKAARTGAIAVALARATDVPLRTAEACLVVLKAAQEAAAHGNPNAVSDSKTAAAMAWAGLAGAAENVRINLGPPGEADAALLAQVSQATREARSILESLGLL